MSDVAPLPEYLVRMVRRIPPIPEVVPGSTPVVAFGEPRIARVATLGINPSHQEFIGRDGLLAGRDRRLATLESLSADGLPNLTDSQVRTVIDDCGRYFSSDRNPYRRWFDPLDEILRRGVHASYYDGTACHLDLSHWATDPVWSGLSASSRQRLLDEGVPHLRDQILEGQVRLIVLNGRQVLDQVQAVRLVRLRPTGTIQIGTVRGTLVEGLADGVRYLGWSTNIQSSWGVTSEFRRQLAAWLASAAAPKHEAEEQPVAHDAIGPDGYIQDVQVRGKAEFNRLLSDWLCVSDAKTIGDGGTFSRRATIVAEVESGHTIRLNSDTKRDAVEAYVDYAARHGISQPWPVVANQRGRRNKVTYRADGTAPRGWYCYLQGTAELAGSI